ncbi:MAG: 3D domain-containing protein [Alphaproteobacteria bacterium]|nr:3D domain-containing protein [Alphaproteobacteria bacterium]
MQKILKPAMALFVIFVSIVLAKAPVYADTTHVVVKGDTLSGIAKQYYGDVSRWQEIFNDNKEIIKDPNLLQVGWILTLGREEAVEPATKKEEIVSRATPDRDILHDVRATAYDLSVASCGKGPSHPGYGVTRSGRQIDGLTRTQASCIAVDPKVIPMGSLVYISFENPDYKQYNDIYQALDTGGAVKGKHVDIFLGDFNSTKESSEVKRFGVTKAQVTILRRGW